MSWRLVWWFWRLTRWGVGSGFYFVDLSVLFDVGKYVSIDVRLSVIFHGNENERHNDSFNRSTVKAWKKTNEVDEPCVKYFLCMFERESFPPFSQTFIILMWESRRQILDFFFLNAENFCDFSSTSDDQFLRVLTDPTLRRYLIQTCNTHCLHKFRIDRLTHRANEPDRIQNTY